MAQAPRGPSGFQEQALPPPPFLSSPAVSDKSLVALGMGISRGHRVLSLQLPRPPWGTGKWVLAAAVIVPECSGVEFRRYNFFSQRKPR